MRVLLQRVSEASVEVRGREVARIGAGLLLFVGVHEEDSREEVDWMAKKIADLRIFEDKTGKFNLSLKSIEGQVLLVSQFTLYGDTRRGRRPSFTLAAPPEHAEPLCALLAAKLREEGFHVEEGIFGARMRVALINDGPVTLLLDHNSRT